MSNVALILINIGSPDSFDVKESKSFLYEMLSDYDMVRMPVVFRKILAKLVSKKKAEYFAKNLEASQISGRPPLRYYMTSLREKISDHIGMRVLTAYRYGGPSIQDAIQLAKKRGAREFVFIPMYPQFAEATTLSAKKIVEKEMTKLKKTWSFCEYYFDDDLYIDALEGSIKTPLEHSDALLVCFHSVPKSQSERCGYEIQCQQTVNLLRDRFPDAFIDIAYQSAMNKKKWVGPSAEDKIQELVNAGIKNLSVICPSFACDCTETIIEIDNHLRKNFMKLGGENFHYIKCLNDSLSHISLFENLFYKYE